MTSARSDRCDIRFSGGPCSNGGFVSGYRFWGELWDYVGIQVTGTGTMDDWEDGAPLPSSVGHAFQWYCLLRILFRCLLVGECGEALACYDFLDAVIVNS